MTDDSLRLRAPVFPTGPRTSVEGGQLVLDGASVRLLVVCDRPTRAEVAAFTHGPIHLAVYERDGIAALAVRIGDPPSRGHLEVVVPLALVGYHGQREGEATGGWTDAHVVLCRARNTTVCAVRRLHVSERLGGAIQHAAHSQPRNETAEATWRREVGLRRLTVDHIIQHATAQDQVAEATLG